MDRGARKARPRLLRQHGANKNRLAYFYSGSLGSANETVGEALSVTFGVLKKFAETGPTQSRSRPPRRRPKAASSSASNSGSALAGGLAYQQLTNRPIDTLDTYVDRINSVTIEEFTRQRRR